MLNDYIEKIKDGFKEGLEGYDSLSEAEELELYKIAGVELESDERDAGLWGKALAKGGSHPEGKYVEYRFEELKTQLIQQKQALIIQQEHKQEELIQQEEATLRKKLLEDEEAKIETEEFLKMAEEEYGKKKSSVSFVWLAIILLLIVVLLYII